VLSFYLVIYFNCIQKWKTQRSLLLVAYTNTCYNKNVLVQPCMISDMVTVWKIALENDFIKSKHVVLKLSFFHLVVVTDKHWMCWYISTLGCQNTDYQGGSTHLWNVGRQSFYTAVYPRRQLWTSLSVLVSRLSAWCKYVERKGNFLEKFMLNI
jgi:hypothetical protein